MKEKLKQTIPLDQKDGSDDLKKIQTVLISISLLLEVWMERNIVKKQSTLKNR